MKIGIIGAGALGCVYGAFLSKNNDVTLILRRDSVKELILKRGIIVETDAGRETVPVKAEINGFISQVFDLVIILVKGYDTIQALTDALPCIGADTTVLTLQNGMGNYENITTLIKPENVVVATSGQGAYIISDAHVRYTGCGFDHFGTIDADVKKAKMCAELFKEAGFDNAVSEDIRRSIWRKLFINIGTNPITAVFGQTNTIVYDNPYGRALSEMVIREAVTVANACGQDFDPEKVLSTFRKVIAAVINNRTSMLQDIENGRKTEIDTINGAVVRMGQQAGVPTPYNEFLTTMVKALEDRTQKNA